MEERNINNEDGVFKVPADNKKIRQNTDDEYKNALASDDPTTIEKKAQEELAKEAIRKFKSL